MKKSCSKGVTVWWMSLEVLLVGPENEILEWSVSEIFSILSKLYVNNKPDTSNQNAEKQVRRVISILEALK